MPAKVIYFILKRTPVSGFPKKVVTVHSCKVGVMGDFATNSTFWSIFEFSFNYVLRQNNENKLLKN